MESEKHPSVFHEVLKMAQEARDCEREVQRKAAQLRENEEAREAARQWWRNHFWPKGGSS
jgi:hypothetical protein